MGQLINASHIFIQFGSVYFCQYKFSLHQKLVILEVDSKLDVHRLKSL